MSSVLVILAIISIYSSNFALAEKIEFAATVKPTAVDCYLEDIAESIQAIVNVKQKNQNDLALTITDPRGKKIVDLQGEEEMRHHFAAFYNGNHQICI